MLMHKSFAFGSVKETILKINVFFSVQVLYKLLVMLLNDILPLFTTPHSVYCTYLSLLVSCIRLCIISKCTR